MDSLKCFSKESILLLHKNKLLLPLISSEIIKKAVSTLSVSEEEKKKCVQSLLNTLNIKNEEEKDVWLRNNYLNQIDFLWLATKDLLIKKYCDDKFESQTESRFLERKSELDIVIYSLLRHNDPNVINELFLRILEKESEFGEIATEYSQGVESKKRGIVGPIPIGRAHPLLGELLKSSTPGKVQPPMKLVDSYVVVRVESFDKAQLDDFMREKMKEELFKIWIEKETEKVYKNIFTSNFSKNNIGEV